MYKVGEECVVDDMLIKITKVDKAGRILDSCVLQRDVNAGDCVKTVSENTESVIEAAKLEAEGIVEAARLEAQSIIEAARLNGESDEAGYIDAKKLLAVVPLDKKPLKEDLQAMASAMGVVVEKGATTEEIIEVLQLTASN